MPEAPIINELAQKGALWIANNGLAVKMESHYPQRREIRVAKIVVVMAPRETLTSSLLRSDQQSHRVDRDNKHRCSITCKKVGGRGAKELTF